VGARCQSARAVRQVDIFASAALKLNSEERSAACLCCACSVHRRWDVSAVCEMGKWFSIPPTEFATFFF